MKISFLGSGKVGSAIAYTVALNGLATEIVMTDAFMEKAYGESLDILEGQAFSPQAKIMYGTIKDTANSDILVVTAGTPRKADEPRVMLLSRNAGLLAQLVKEAVSLSPNSIILVVTNPLDVMTYLAYCVSGFPANRVLGLGTVLDTARYRSYLATQFNLDARDLDAYVIGEHGETMVPVTSNITVKGIPLNQIPCFDQEALHQTANEVISASGRVIGLKGGTVFAPAASATAIIKAIVTDSQTVLPVCSYHSKYDLSVSLPTIIDRSGAGPVLELPLSPEEESAFEHSIKNIRAFLSDLKSNSLNVFN